MEVQVLSTAPPENKEVRSRSPLRKVGFFFGPKQQGEERSRFTYPRLPGIMGQRCGEANEANPNVLPDLLFHDLRRSGVRVMVQEAGIPESQAMLISGHRTRAMLERYNIVSLKNVQDAVAKLDAWSKRRSAASAEHKVQIPTAS